MLAHVLVAAFVAHTRTTRAQECNCQNASQALESLVKYAHNGTTEIHNTNETAIGWVSGPPNRGSRDIIWTCLTAIALATWSNLCLNLPGRHEGWLRVHWRRLYWMIFTIYWPDFVMANAYGQYLAAKDSVKNFREAHFHDWTDKHAFFADMGGFEIQVADAKFLRVNSKHLLHLIQKGYVDYPHVTEDEIKDKSKKDTLAKAIMTMQMGYVVVQTVVRPMGGLHVSALEHFAMEIIVCSIAIGLWWLRKPSDIEVPIVLKLISSEKGKTDMSNSDIAWDLLQRELGKVDDLKPSWSSHLECFIGLPFSSRQKPATRFKNDRIPNFGGTQCLIFSLASMIHSALHVAAWNMHLPTTIELIWWRVASCVIFGSTFLYWTSLGIARALWSFFLKRRNSTKANEYKFLGAPPAATITSYKPTISEEVQNDVESGREKDDEEHEKIGPPATPPWQLPHKVHFWIWIVVFFFYVLARTFLIVESFLSFRSLPATVYQEVDWKEQFGGWTGSLPHF